MMTACTMQHHVLKLLEGTCPMTARLPEHVQQAQKQRRSLSGVNAKVAEGS